MMKTLKWMMMVVLFAVGAQADVIVSNTAWTGGLAGWNSASSALADNPAATSLIAANTYDDVYFKINSGGASQYSSLYKKPGYGQNSSMGADELNYFNNALNIQWDLGALGGSTGGNKGENTAYLWVFDMAASGLTPAANVGNGIAIMLENSYYAAGGYDIYKLVVRETTAGAFSDTIYNLNLASPVAPTAINIELSGNGSGTGYSIDLIGAALNTGDVNITGEIGGLIATDYSGYALSIGARNDGVVGTGTEFTLEGITVEQIPEPATLGLVVAVGGAMLFIRRRFMM